MDREQKLTAMFHDMHEAMGDSHWWPADSPFEIAVGAVLTQNTNWKNVDKALDNLKQSGVLSPSAMRELTVEELAELIRPAGFFRVKANRLKHLLSYLEKYDDDFEYLKSGSLHTRREQLLSVKGIGPETADCILLYALGFPVFVVDAYTRRMLSRHGLLPADVHYAEMQEFFMDVLPADVQMFNEYHALIVRLGKDWCRKSKPLCKSCPLYNHLQL